MEVNILTLSRLVRFLTTLIMPVVGALCIIFPNQITKYLPFVMGGAMILLGGLHISLRFAKALQRRDRPRRTDISFIIFVLGIVILIMGKSSVSLIGTIWGLYGLWQSCYSFHKGVMALHNREKFVMHFVICVIRLAIALLLLFDPEGEFAHHIVILGIDIIIDTVKGPHSHKKRDEPSLLSKIWEDNDDLIPKKLTRGGERIHRDRLDIFHDIGAEHDDAVPRSETEERNT